MMLSKTRSRSNKRPKKPKSGFKALLEQFRAKPPWKARKKRIAARSIFKAHGDNPLKSYRRRFTDYQVMVRAQVARQDRLRNRTAAEIRFSEILDSMRMLYESEAIFQNGDRFILADFYFKAHKFVIELDGSAHDGQKGYDAGRDRWLLSQHGVRTVRLTNKYVLSTPRFALDKALAEIREDRKT
jgi:very-short-patch-repair endonuclease